MKTLFIIKLGTAFECIKKSFGDFDQWTKTALGSTDMDVGVVDTESGASLPQAKDCAGVILTGSHSMVTDNLPWSIEVENWIPEILKARIPFLGICYGHQVLAKAAGGQVGFHPKGREIGTVKIYLLSAHAKDKLFGELPKQFAAHTVHSQSVLRLPPEAIHLATSADEVHHAFRIGDCAWGIQFHPEFTEEIMEAYIRTQAKELLAEGRDVEKLLLMIDETPAALKIARNFCRMVRDRKSRF